MLLYIIIVIIIIISCFSSSISISGLYIIHSEEKEEEEEEENLGCNKQYNHNCITKEEYILNNLLNLLFNLNDTDNTINIFDNKFLSEYFSSYGDRHGLNIVVLISMHLSYLENILDLENSDGIFTKASLSLLILKSIHFLLMINRPEMTTKVSELSSQIGISPPRGELADLLNASENAPFYIMTNMDYNRSVDYDYFKQFLIDKMNSESESTTYECTNINGPYNRCLSEEEYILNNLIKLLVSFFDVNNTGIINITTNEKIDLIMRKSAELWELRTGRHIENLEDDITSLKSFAISLINILENLIGMTQSYGILTKNKISKLIIKSYYEKVIVPLIESGAGASSVSARLMSDININHNQINTYEKFLNTIIDLIDN